MVSYGPIEETYTADNLAATYGGPVIMLGRAGADEPAHTHHFGDHAHHQHVHENLGGEHD
jgi:hypothetical protein